jgi:pyruvate dehydrogenase E2 component (dihydrolipoamide acetyltransferase)
MAIEVTIPRLGWSMEEGVLTAWLKNDGQRVRKGDMLFVLEADKATQEIESFDEGILRLPPEGPRPGDTVKVGQVIAYLVAEGEAAPFAAAKSASSETPQVAAETHAPRANGPAARRLARKLAGQGTEPPTAAVVQTISHSSPRGAAKHASPRARRQARQLGIDWTRLNGTGKGGRVRERDVLAARQQAPAPQPAEPLERPASSTPIPHTAIRRAIAQRMVASHQSTAPVTLTTTLDATNLVNLREQFRAAAPADGLVPSYTDLIVKLTAIALREHPALNASWEEDAIVAHARVNVGIAVDTSSGLLVPVVRDADRIGLRDLARCSRALVERANGKQLAADDMQGGTFTVSNLGSYGIDAFTPIINGPQCAILGVGRIRRQPAVVNDQVVPRDMLTLSLTFDHRMVDGGPAARFLQTLAKSLENPAGRLIE